MIEYFFTASRDCNSAGLLSRSQAALIRSQVVSCLAESGEASLEVWLLAGLKSLSELESERLEEELEELEEGVRCLLDFFDFLDFFLWVLEETLLVGGAGWGGREVVWPITLTSPRLFLWWAVPAMSLISFRNCRLSWSGSSSEDCSSPAKHSKRN